MAEIAVRPSWNDASLIEEVLAADVASRWFRSRRTVDRLVVDAHLAVRQGDWARMSQDAAVPLLIDPVTSLGQTDQPPDDAWTKLPYGRAEALTLVELGDAHLRRAYVTEVLRSQLELGASGLVAPYFYSSGPQDPWFEMSLQVLHDAAHVAATEAPGVPLAAVFSGQARAFTSTSSHADGVDRFADAAGNIGASLIAVCLSPMGKKDGLRKVLPYYMTLVRLLERSETRTMAWRQGVHGPILVAAGLDGYETGAGQGEYTDLARIHRSRWVSHKRREKRRSGEDTGGGSYQGVFLEPLGRSLPQKAAAALLGDVSVRPMVMCDDESCCPKVAATLDDASAHALRARSRQIARLEQQPSAEWRLFDATRRAVDAASMVEQANDVLSEAGLTYRLDGDPYLAIGEAARALGEAARTSAA